MSRHPPYVLPVDYTILTRHEDIPVTVCALKVYVEWGGSTFVVARTLVKGTTKWPECIRV